MLVLILISFFALVYLLSVQNRRLAIKRASALCQEHKQEVDWRISNTRLSSLSDRLGRAGFYSIESRRVFYIFVAISFICTFVILINLVPLFVALLLSVYLITLAALLFLKFKANDIERETLFKLPLFLESVILLVESGLGVLPAVQNVTLNSKNKNEPVIQVMQAVYEFSSSGLPFKQALELVGEVIENKQLRHVLLHLDISNSEGGALIPSLRNLAEYAHKEWKLSVENRVKKLENAVVFPVFAAVIGLMLLVVAVPIVPVVDFFKGLEQNKQLQQVDHRIGALK